MVLYFVQDCVAFRVFFIISCHPLSTQINKTKIIKQHSPCLSWGQHGSWHWGRPYHARQQHWLSYMIPDCEWRSLQFRFVFVNVICGYYHFTGGRLLDVKSSCLTTQEATVYRPCCFSCKGRDNLDISIIIHLQTISFLLKWPPLPRPDIVMAVREYHVIMSLSLSTSRPLN